MRGSTLKLFDALPYRCAETRGLFTGAAAGAKGAPQLCVGDASEVAAQPTDVVGRDPRGHVFGSLSGVAELHDLFPRRRNELRRLVVEPLGIPAAARDDVAPQRPIEPPQSVIR